MIEFVFSCRHVGVPYGVPQPYPVPVSVSSPLTSIGLHGGGIPVGGGYGHGIGGYGGISTLGLGGISQYRYGGLNSISSLGGYSNLGHSIGGISTLDHGIGLSSLRHGVTTLGHGIGGSLSIGAGTLGSGYASAYASLASPSISTIKVISSPSLTPLHHSGLLRYGGGGISLGTTKIYTSPLRFTISKHHHW